ncbi:MAG: DUF3793 family protein [Lachnospiraceae bacterium]|nr:DUF3793 family protein [Lachnospiraceae bacterium]
MSQDVLEIVRGMDLTSVEAQLVLQCAPLIAGLKASNLLIVQSENVEKVTQIIKETDISFVTLWETEEKTTLLLYKAELLKAYLLDGRVQDLLRKWGYENTELREMLPIFQEHYADYMAGKKPFPHEIGVFLAYPVEDVEGFIRYEGKNSLYAGYWKVYADLASKLRLFEEFESAKETLIRLMSYGMGIRNIIVSYCKNNKIVNSFIGG